MRLDQTEKAALRHALKGVKGQAYLFGSRVKDDGRGGDIDVLIISEQDPFALSRQVASRFFMRCEEKIDVIVMKPAERTAEEQAFVNTLDLVPLEIRE